MSSATLSVPLARHSTRFLEGDALLAGRWIAGGARIEVEDPATGESIGTVAPLDAADVDRAVDAADAAFPAWRALLPLQRGSILRRWGSLSATSAKILPGL